ncbi:MAG: gliding motility-associated C-terminal domain-containing protein [Bacteroidia bacterium]|nr:gliding motility-associated C-terminal domain-containing protein [Bacteroidia bacterium]
MIISANYKICKPTGLFALLVFLFLMGGISDAFAQPSNDNVCGAIALTINTSACTYYTGDNTGATATAGVPAPGCASYQGADIWFSVTVPAGGHLVFDTQAGTVTDAGMAIYSASSCSGPFTLIACDDDAGSGLMPRIDKTGLTPGFTIYIRMWNYGSGSTGTMGVCVLNPPDPTSGDCLAAVPVCNNTYNPSLSPSGPGVYGEAPWPRTYNQGCGTWEQNSTWYAFTVQTAGIFTFTLYSSVDYDWALYDITYSNCWDILNGTNLPVRCNYSATTGNTGLNTSYSNYNEPATGSPWCAAISVTAGSKFVLLVDNYTGGTTNYSLSFNPAGSGGTAGIYDNTGPSLGAITPPACGSTTLSFQFSEDVSCSSVSVGDLQLTGPGGPYTLSNLVGWECSAGADYGRNFTVNVSPSLFTSGNFTLSMIGSISDKCNNPTNTTVNLPFTITNVTATASITQNINCYGASTGAVSANGSGGTSPYSYQWNSSPAQNTQTATGLPAGTYSCTITDMGGCNAVASVTLNQPAALNPGSIASAQTICYNSTPATLISTVGASGGTGSLNYQWQYTVDPSCTSGWTDIPGATGPTYSPSALTQTRCLRRKVTDNCTSNYSNTVTVTVNPLPVINSANSSNVSFCGGSDGTISINATGVQPLYYSINGGGSFVANGGGFSGLPNGNYPVAVRDNNGCIAYGPTLTILDGGAPPSPTAGSNATYCQGAPLSNLWASALSGGSIRWYSDPSLNTQIGSGNTLTPFNTVGTSSYYVTETVSGCESAPSLVTVTINPIPVASANPPSQTICSGGNTGISLSSSVTNTNFSWTIAQAGVTGGYASNGTFISQTLTSLTGQGTAVYTITPTANGCTGSAINATIIVNPIPTVVATPAAQTICSGTSTSISLSSSVSSTGYSWTVVQGGVTGGFDSNGPLISQTLVTTAFSQGSAVYTITPSANSCNGSPINVTVTVNPLPDIFATPPSSTICSGTSTNITLNSSVSGTGFTWTVNQSNVAGAFAGNGNNITQTLNNSGTSTGTATYTVTPSAGSCNGSPLDVVVTVNPIPDVIASPASQTICTYGNTNINLSSNVTGTTFNWTYSTVDVINASNGSGTNISQVLGNSGTVPATITYIITPSYTTCNGSPLNVVVTVNPYPNVIPTPPSDTICSSDITNISLSSNVPSATFTWTVTENGVSGGSASGGSTLAQTLNYIATPATATYIITPTAYSCTGLDDTVAIYVNPVPVIVSEDTTYVSVCGGSDGTITIVATGNPPLGYSIDGGISFVQNGGLFTNLSLGSYPVEVRNGIGCIAHGSTLSIAEVGAPPAPVAGNDAIYCFGDAMTGLFATPGYGGYIQWYSDPGMTNLLATSSTLTPLSTVGTTTYYATETTGGCESTPTPVVVTIKQSPVLIANPSSQSICNGGTANISLTSNPVGATFNWTVTQVNVSGATPGSGSSISQTLTNSSAFVGTATYSVIPTVDGCNGIPQDIVVTVNPIPGVQLNFTIPDVCQNVTNVILSGGTPPGGTYSGVGVSGNNFVPSVAGLGPHVITYTYTDGNTCTGSATDTMTVHSLPNVNLSDTLVCANSSSFTLTNGTPPGGTYYGNGVTGVIFDPAAAGIGTHTITYNYSDTYGCSNSATNTITVSPMPVADINYTTPITCHGMTDGTAMVTANGGTLPYTYHWDNNPPGTGQTASGLGPNFWYHVTVTDFNGCTAKDSVLLTDPPLMTLTTQAINPTCGLSNGYVAVNVTGGTSPYVYHWGSYPDSLGHSLSNVSAAVYFVTVSDNHGCSLDTLISITTSPFVSATLIITNVSCYGGFNGSVATIMTGGTAPFSYLWSNGQTTGTITGLSADTLSLVVTDSHGCTFSDTVVVSQPPELLLALITTDVKCFGGTGTIATSVTGGTQPYTYHWNTNYVGPALTGAANTPTIPSYSVTVTDSLGCTVTGMDTLFQPSSVLNVTLSSDSAKCYGDTLGSADVFATGGTSPYSYIWSAIPIQTNPHAINLHAGVYTVTVTDHNSCHETGTIEVYQPARIDLDSSITPTSCEEGDDGVIMVHASGGKLPYTFHWYTDPVQTDSIADGLYHGSYDIKITDSRGCFQIYTIDLPNTPEPCLEIPSAFTPNGDGLHDLWNIKNLHLYPHAVIEVYNRWGSLIYKAGTSDKRWDGTYNGTPVASGTYVYIVDLDNGTKARQGTVTIIR